MIDRRLLITAKGRELLNLATIEEMRQLLEVGNTEEYEVQYTDFRTSNPIACGYGSSASGTGAGVWGQWDFQNATSGMIGVMGAYTGTTATGWASLTTYDIGVRFDMNTAFNFKSRSLVDVLSTASQEYRLYVGFQDQSGTTTAPSNHCGFRYDRATYSDNNWRCVTRKWGTETVTDSSVAVVAGTTGTPQLFEIDVNADGDEAVFKIDGSTVATHTTNVPDTADMGYGAKIVKTAGTTQRRYAVDWIRFSLLGGAR